MINILMIRHKLILLLLSIILPALAHGSSFIVDQNESIQAAIDGARPGDTILVSGGIYNESLIINKTLLLLGIGMPEIDSGEDEVAVNLSAGGSVLNGFFINCSNQTSKGRQGIKAISNNNLIINNVIKNYNHGIAVLNSSHNILEGNTVQDGDAGIYVSGGSLNKAIGVDASNNDYGIHLHNTTDSIVEGCNASHNSYGIFLDAARNCTVADNKVSFNQKYGIQLRRADGNSLTGNNASHNSWEGIYLEDCSKNTIAGCNISYNDEDGISLKGGQVNSVIGSAFLSNKYNGISLDSSVGDAIIGNAAWNNQRRGFSILRCTDCILLDNDAGNNNLTGIEVNRGRANKLIDNNASGNLDGISIDNADGYTVSDNLAFYNKKIGIELIDLSNSTVANNTASNNQIGAFLFDTTRNTFRENDVSKNDLIAIFIESGLDNLIASNNASDNLAGIVLLNSRNNSLEENRADSRSAAIALQDSSGNRIFRNIAHNNKIGIYLNRSNASQMEENRLENNGVGLAVNLSDLNLSNKSVNYIINNEYNILRNENQSISNYQIWREKIGTERMEVYLRSHEDIETLLAGTETTFVHPSSSAALASSTQARSTSRDASPNLRIKIESEPGGAEIWIDGKPTRAVTPSERTLDGKGYHDIELFLKGYEPLKETIYVTSSTAIRLELTPEQQQQKAESDAQNIEVISDQRISNQNISDQRISDLYVILSSNPDGASIWLNGENTGKSTPDRIKLSRYGNHTFDLFLSGYEIYQGEIDISEQVSEPLSMNITLTPREPPAGSLPDAGEERPPLPGFLSWQHLAAISLAYYALAKGRCRSH